MKHPPNFIDLTGKKFGRWTVLEYVGGKGAMWRCQCKCGNIKYLQGQVLRYKQSKSCGCYFSEKLIERNTTHNLSRTNFYNIFRGLKNRCENPNVEKFPLYGARGIKCFWKSFEEFRDDMYEPYLEHIRKHGRRNTTIDRIDNDGHYCKENCRWTTHVLQQRNRSKNRILEFNGQKKCLAEWAEIVGIKTGTLHIRLKRNWSVEKTLTTPVRN